jgi:hypothetical protein
MKVIVVTVESGTEEEMVKQFKYYILSGSHTLIKFLK